MAKGFSSSKKRFGRRRLRSTGRKRRVVATIPKSFQLTRTLYPPLPAQFKCSVQRHFVDQWNVAPTAYAAGSLPLITVFAGGALPSGFQQLHFLYGKSVVDFVEVSIQFTNVGPTTFDICTAVIPYSDALALNGANGHNRIATAAERRTSTLGLATGGQASVQYYFTVNLRKVMNQPDDTLIQTTSDDDGTLTFPVIVGVAAMQSSPNLAFSAQNMINQAGLIYVTYNLRFHCTFSNRHASDIVAVP